MVVDRSLDHEETVVVEVAGEKFRVKEGLTVREVAAHLLTPDIDGEVENILREIHEAGERKMRFEEEPEFNLKVNGHKANFNTPLEGEEIFHIETRPT